MSRFRPPPWFVLLLPAIIILSAVVLIPLLLSQYLGVERIGASYGLMRFFQSGSNLFGPIVGGHLWETTGELSSTFYFMGSVMTVGTGFALALPLALWRMMAPSSSSS